MKTWLITLLTACQLGFASPMCTYTISATALEEITAFFKISQEEIQEKWLRPQDKERWEIDEIPEEKKVFVLNWAEKHGLFTTKTPEQKSYDIAVIFGASTHSMKQRLHYLEKLWEEGTRCSKVLFLTGERPLDAHVDHLIDECSTESEAASLLWGESQLSEKLPAQFIQAPMTSKGRPGAREVIRAWLATSPEPCTALFVANQPFCGYFFAILNDMLPPEIDFDVVGKAAGPRRAAVILDTLARWIYTEMSSKFGRGQGISPKFSFLVDSSVHRHTVHQKRKVWSKANAGLGQILNLLRYILK